MSASPYCSLPAVPAAVTGNSRRRTTSVSANGAGRGKRQGETALHLAATKNTFGVDAARDPRHGRSPCVNGARTNGTPAVLLPPTALRLRPGGRFLSMGDQVTAARPGEPSRPAIRGSMPRMRKPLMASNLGRYWTTEPPQSTAGCSGVSGSPSCRVAWIRAIQWYESR